ARPHGLSRMAELAWALVREPKVLLLDEPSAGLDLAETADLGARLRALQEERAITTLVIDHDLRLVRHVARHIVVLSFGEVIAEGDWDLVRKDPKVVAAYSARRAPTPPTSPSACPPWTSPARTTPMSLLELSEVAAGYRD